MNRCLKFLVVIVLYLFFTGQAVHAQSDGKLQGIVTDSQTGNPLSGANVVIRGTNLGGATDLDGRFFILRIPPGVYDVEVSYIGYRPMIVEKVLIKTDLTTKQSFRLIPSPVAAGEAVVLVAERPLIQRDLTSVEAHVDAAAIEDMPVTELSEILTLQAGVTEDDAGAIHIRGGRTSEIAYMINGISITDDYNKSQAVEVMNDGVAELQVISGAFNAEYGNAMSGIVNVVTKTGSNEFDFKVEAEGGDYISGDKELYPNLDSVSPYDNNNLTVQASGPVIRDRLTFFVSGRRAQSNGWIYGINRYLPTGRLGIVGDTMIVATPGDSSYVAMNSNLNLTGQAVLKWQILPALVLKADLLASSSTWRAYDHDYRLNPHGTGENNNFGHAGILSLTYLISKRSYLDLSVAQKLNGTKYSVYDDPLDSRYVHSDSALHADYAFRTAGNDLSVFDRSTRSSVFKADFTSQVSFHHQVKTGIEYQSDVVRYNDIDLIPAEDENGQEIFPFTPAISPTSQETHDRYKRTPFRYAAYIQDKIEYESVVVNVGVRFDQFDPQGKLPVDPEDPNIYTPLKLRHKYHDLNGNGAIDLSEQVEENEYSLAEKQSFWYKNTTAKTLLSPRFGISYPITDRGNIHFSYGIFQQVPEYDLLYTEDERKLSEGADVYGPFGNPDLKPQQTTMYELGIAQQLTDRMAINVTGFYRDIRNWISAGAIVPTSVASVSYVTYVNRDFANVRGLTVMLDGQLSRELSVSADYTYQLVDGTNSAPEDEFWSQIDGEEPTKTLTPLNWDQRHTLNLYANFRKKNYGLSLLTKFNSGQPYTPEILTGSYTGRSIISGLSENSRRKPFRWNADLMAYRTFEASGLDFKLSLQVYNLFDTRNAITVFEDTGEAGFSLNELLVTGADDGYFIRPDYYSKPRSILIGVSCEF